MQADQTIGSYRIVRPLGKGGMGTVYEVAHEKLGAVLGASPAGLRRPSRPGT